MTNVNQEAAQLLADMGYDTAWYSPSPTVEPTYNIDITPFRSNVNDLESTSYTPLAPLTQPAQVPPATELPITSSAPVGQSVGWWGDIKDWFKDDYWGGVQDSLTDPFGPIDDIFKTPGNIIGGVKDVMGILPLIMLMGGKLDWKKMILLMMMGGGLGAIGSGIGDLFGSNTSSNPFGGGQTNLVSSDSGIGGMNPMMLMLMMGNKKMDPMMMMMMGMDPMTSMLMGSLTSSTGRRSYRRRGYSNASKRSYNAGLNAGTNRALLARA